MAQIDQTRPHEPVPGLADQIIRHTQQYNVQFSKGVDRDQINDLSTDAIYECCPFSGLIDAFPGYDDWSQIHQWTALLDQQMTVKGKNEWSKRIIDHIKGRNAPKKEVPFWRR